MSQNDDQSTDQPLADVLRKIDENANSNVESSSDSDLSNSQVQELAEAQECLDYLQRVRNLCENESLDIHGDSTLGGTRNHSERHHTIDRFEIIRELGQGGFAAVYLADDPVLQRRVALKVPKPATLESKDALIRFRREAQAAAILSHPNVVPVFETGEIGPLAFIAYAYIQGTTLSDWITNQTAAVDIRQAARITSVLAEAVQHAHQRGVVHRDLKPANILIEECLTEESTSTELASRLRIADFGLAKYETEDDLSLTRTGGLVGTPAYMSPEQALGKDDVGSSADIFALGVILYELLTGKLPHRKETYLATLKAIEQEPPVAPRKHRPEIPRDLEAICLKCLEKSPNDRYTSANELQADLDRFLGNRPVGARRPSPMQRLDKWARRNKIIVRTASVAALLTIIGLATSLALVSRANKKTKKALVEKTEAEADAQARLADARDVVDEFYLKLSDRLEGMAGVDSLREELADQALTYYLSFVKQDANDPDTRVGNAKAFQKAGMLLARQSRPEARDHFHKALQIFKELPEQEYEVAHLHYLIGKSYSNSGKNEPAIEQLTSALKLYDKLDVTSPTMQKAMARLHHQLAISFTGIGDFAESKPNLEKAEKICRSLDLNDESTRQILAMTLNSMSTLAQREGRKDDRRDLLEQAITHMDWLVEQFPNDVNHRHYQADMNLKLAAGMPNGVEKEKAIRQCMAVYEKLTRENPKVQEFRKNLASCYRDLANVLNTLDQPDVALDFMNRATKCLEESTDEKAIGNLGAAWNNRAFMHFRNKEYPQAIEALQRAVEHTGKASELNPSSTYFLGNLANHYFGIGDVYKRMGEHEQSLKNLELSAKYRKRVLELSPTQTLHRLRLVSSVETEGEIYDKLESYDKAIKKYREALDAATIAHHAGSKNGTKDAVRVSNRLLKSAAVADNVVEFTEVISLQRKLFQSHPDSQQTTVEYATALLENESLSAQMK
ncbi:MAG: protein kinase, partial [Planctomycetota bacterium]